MATVGHTTEDVSNLPAWARKRIERLAAEVASLKKQQAALAAGDTNMWLPSGLDLDETTPLPRDSTVRVKLSKHDTIDVRPKKTDGGESYIEVRSSTGRLIIEPAVTNVIYVKVGR